MNSAPLQIRTFRVMPTSAFTQRHALNAVAVLLSGFASWRLGFVAELPAVFAFIFGGVLLSAIDWKVQRLPTRLVYLMLAAVGAGLLLAAVIERRWTPLVTAVAGGVLFANGMFLIWVATRQVTGMMLLGFGDVRLAAVLGLLLGWYGLPYVLYGAIVGHVLVAAVAVGTCIRRRRLTLRYSFGPPLLAGTLAVVLLHG